MLVLDTNHLSELENRRSGLGSRLLARLDAATEETATTVVTVEEQLAGRIAQIRGQRDLQLQISGYRRLQQHIDFFAAWMVLPFDKDAAELVASLRSQGVRVGTMDLKIAAITLVHGAMLLTRNTVDFAKVPGLRFANWLD
jgi:tRNA(fMet)-specific endonuclease VapC